MVEQAFETGLMLWRADTGMVYGLANLGGNCYYAGGNNDLESDRYRNKALTAWEAHPGSETGTLQTVGSADPFFSTPDGQLLGVWLGRYEGPNGRLGWAVGPQRTYRGLIQKFAAGLIVMNDSGRIYAMHATGTWSARRERLGTYAWTPQRGRDALLFGRVVAQQEVPFLKHAGDAGVRSESLSSVSMSQAVEGAQPIEIVEQFFEFGVMLWRSDTRQIYVLASLNNICFYASSPPTVNVFLRAPLEPRLPAWKQFTDEYREGDPERPSVGVPSGVLRAPIRGFGRVWREQLDGPEARVGWATSPEHAVSATIAEAGSGITFTTDTGQMYQLESDGAWASRRSEPVRRSVPIR